MDRSPSPPRATSVQHDSDEHQPTTTDNERSNSLLTTLRRTMSRSRISRDHYISVRATSPSSPTRQIRPFRPASHPASSPATTIPVNSAGTVHNSSAPASPAGRRPPCSDSEPHAAAAVTSALATPTAMHRRPVVSKVPPGSSEIPSPCPVLPATCARRYRHEGPHRPREHGTAGVCRRGQPSTRLTVDHPADSDTYGSHSIHRGRPSGLPGADAPPERACRRLARIIQASMLRPWVGAEGIQHVEADLTTQSAEEALREHGFETQ